MGVDRAISEHALVRLRVAQVKDEPVFPKTRDRRPELSVASIHELGVDYYMKYYIRCFRRHVEVQSGTAGKREALPLCHVALIAHGDCAFGHAALATCEDRVVESRHDGGRVSTRCRHDG